MANKIYMITMPKNGRNKFLLKNLIEKNDLHKWAYGYEVGRSGYKHIQARIRCPFDFDYLQEYFGSAHIEEASDEWDYETKSGTYFTSEDWGDRLKQRYLPLRKVQREAVAGLEATNDREVYVWYDKEGNAGKSWLCGHLWETGKAYVVDSDKGETIKKDVANEFINHGWRPYVIIDLPRTAKWTDELYYSIEKIKDGLLKDPRYQSKTVNIHGVKVMVMCNSMPKLDKLSDDRWVVFSGAGVPPNPPAMRTAGGLSRSS